MLTIILKTILGLFILTFGAELLVRGAVKLANRFAISPLIIGLTIVAVGTSMPELTVSLLTSLQGKYELSLGNVVGSNIFNVLFILGASAIITPLSVSRHIIKFDVPIMIFLSLLVFVLGHNGVIDRWEGLTFISLYLIYTFWLVKESRKEKSLNKNNDEFAQQYIVVSPSKNKEKIIFDFFYIFSGIAGLIIGSKFFINGAVDIARILGLSELIISLTILSIGTSLPELATSLMAAIRGEKEIAVGNVVGSNIFNILGVLGLSTVISDSGLLVEQSVLNFDIPIMILVALTCLPILWSRFEISRGEGFFFLIYYCLYTLLIILRSTHPQFIVFYNEFLFYGLLPMTIFVIFINMRKRQ